MIRQTECCTDNAHLQRPKRQSFSNAKTHLDAQISYLLAALPFQIDLAEEKIEKKVKFLVFNKLTWGWAVVVGGLLDFYSDFVKNNRTLGNFGDISAWWGYGTRGFYALGFGFPYLLSLPQDNLPCHASDFLEVLNDYRLSNGLDELFSTSLPVSSIRKIIGEFDAWMRIKIACITDVASDHVEVAEVVYLLDELLAAVNLRIDIEEAEREKIKMETEAQNMPDNKSMQNSETSVQVETDTQGTTTIVNIP